ncbi:MAG: hypothetical protein ACRD33_04150 [Candidatus Acidiferrales bacterium]
MSRVDGDGTFDIFRHHEDGPIWVQAVRGHDEAMRLIVQLSAEHPTKVFRIWDPRNAKFVDLPADPRDHGETTIK